ncbi:MAG: response regulator, partial [Planctomycetota bacterium]
STTRMRDASAVAEDDPSIGESLRIRLTLSGYDVVQARSVLEAHERLESDAPQLVLLDVSLPGGTGFDVAETLRARPETRTAPIVFLTASQRPDHRARAERLGDGVRYFTKPFVTRELLASIEGLLL